VLDILVPVHTPSPRPRGRYQFDSLVIPRYSNTINEPNVSLKYPDIARLRLSPSCLEITDYFGRVQRFRIVWIRTGFGRHRAILVCGSCDCGAIRLFARYGTYACRHCHKAVYASQKTIKSAVNASPPLAASRLQARYRRLRDAIGTGEIGLHFAQG
jgi:hypothetical protein